MKRTALLVAAMAFTTNAFALNAWPINPSVDAAKSAQLEAVLQQEVDKQKLENNLKTSFEACKKELLNYKTFKPNFVAQSWLKVMDSYNDLRAVSGEAVLPWSHEILKPLPVGWGDDLFSLPDFINHHAWEWYQSGADEYYKWIRTLNSDKSQYQQ